MADEGKGPHSPNAAFEDKGTFMKSKDQTKKELAEVEKLRARLEEAEETLGAIRSGKVDALVVSTPQGDQVFTLEGAETPYRVLIEALNEGAGTILPDGTILYCNGRMASILKTPLDRVIGSSMKDYIARGDEEKFLAMLQESGKDCPKGQIHLLDGEGSLVPVHLSFCPLQVEDAGAICMVVTDLAEQERDHLRLISAIEQATEGIVITDPGGKIEYLNPAFERISEVGRSELLEKRYCETLAGSDESLREKLRDIVRRGETWKGRVVRRKDGQAYELDVTYSPIRDSGGKIVNYLGTERDVTREVGLQQRVQQMQKMESIGTLTGGIAHDFNNLLATIVINSEMALFDLPGESGVRNHLELIVKSGLRGRELAKQLLLFSRKSEKKQEVLPLTPLIKETFKLLRSSLPTTFQMKIHLETESDAVFADPSQMQQVIMNLCTNAAYAMRGLTGSIDISLQGITFGANDLPDPDMKPGEYLVLSVKDTGSGMDEEVRKRVFEPFFTTKPVGEGTGLGLSVVYGIVKEHGGNITVYSEPGRGSIFKVYLPKADTGVSARPGTPGPIPKGNERILFVDDEEIIVKSVRNMLEYLGYKVTALMDSKEALRLFSEEPSQFDLVMTDQTMPFMTGEILGRELMRIRSDIPVILCTGYADLISPEKATAMGFRGFIMKPFTVREGAELVRRVLDQDRPK